MKIIFHYNFTSNSLNNILKYGPISDYLLTWETQETFDYFMPDDKNIIKYNPLYINDNNIIQTYLPQKR